MNRRIMLVCILLLLLSGCAQEEKDTFIVGMECGSAPYNWTESEKSDTNVEIDGGQYCEGYDVQISKIIADYLGKELVIKKVSWEGLILSLQTGQIDAIIAGMSPTDERKKEISFTDSYYTEDIGFGIVVNADGAYGSATTVDDFENASVAGQIGTFYIDLLEQLPGVTPIENMSDFTTMTVSLQSNEIDGFVADSNIGAQIASSNDNMTYVLLDGEGGFVVEDYMIAVAIGIAKDQPELLDQVNQALDQISVAEQLALMEQANTETFSVGSNFLEQVWSIFQNNKTSFLRGTITTLFISLSATAIGFLIALFVAITRHTKVTGMLANVYIAIFRGTPMMVQAMVIYYGVSMTIPSFRWADLPFGNVIAGIIVVSVNTGAYLAETIRSGIQSLDKGQFEAAKSLGFTNWQTMSKIILPQAIRNMIPALGNELIINVKDTSVLTIITVTELFFVSNGIAATTWQIFQTFTITALIYLTLTTILTILLRVLELRLDKTKERSSNYPAKSFESV